MKTATLYNVVYYPRPTSRGQVLDYGKPKWLANYLREGYKTTTHKIGQIKLEKH